MAVCPPFLEAFTLGPVVDAVRQATPDVARLGLSALAGVLRPLFPEWAGRLPTAPQSLADASVVRHQIFRAQAELLDRLGVEVLVVEDVHWADATTLDFLMYVASRRPRPLSLMLTYRPEEVPPNSRLLRLTSCPPAGVCQERVALGELPTVRGARPGVLNARRPARLGRLRHLPARPDRRPAARAGGVCTAAA
ncbi:hypothetical protein GCM10010121_087280 [Streptomyces brasiliensis]|uniref:Orc1-like AAA ATPase domain-containing protein n=1 Tax=Streptomyces brasiliensis TaxID=1954 RepID=A0A917P5X9_9ACTN|nr:hypothetical protein GCM10010121_087280 [Streptomyces brasiliensis]